MNILERAKHYVGGGVDVTLWLGSGAECVSQEVAEERASICRLCTKNQPGEALDETVAAAVKRYLEFKNQMELKVPKEEELLSCKGCDCQLKLLIWETQDRIVKQTDAAERASAPGHCWKLRTP